MTLEELDQKGKSIFISLLTQFEVDYRLTDYQYDRVDIYFGKSSVGEIKYRLKSYPSFLIEETKFRALQHVPVARQYYITVLDTDIYLWSVPTIRKYLPEERFLPTDVNKSHYVSKMVRLLPVTDADFHFIKVDDKWQLKHFE